MKREKLKALFVSNHLEKGGAERFVSNALMLLDKSKFDLHLALFRNEIVYDLPDEAEVHLLHKYTKFDIPKLIWKLASLISTLRPEVVLSPHSGINHFVGEALSLSRHQPYWIARVAANPEFENKGLYGLWSRRVHRKADLVLVNAQSLRQPVEEIFGVGSKSICCLYNPTIFKTIDHRAGLPSPIGLKDKRTIVAAGRLERVKRFDLLLEAFALVRQELDCQLVLLGEGPLRAALENYAKKLGISEDFILPGFLNNPYPVMSQADLFVLSSEFEGLPNVLIEAQGLGVPAVATDCPTGPREILENGKTGLLVPVGDTSALCRGMIELLSNDEKRQGMGRYARELARNRFDAPVLIADLTKILMSGAATVRSS